jgi:O-antigen/teichoic acid export membrane protein
VPSVFASISPESAESFLALLIGFAVAGLISSGYQLVTQRPASFRLLEQGPHPATFAAIPFLVFAAPFIIMRNTVRGRRIERRRFEFVMIATVIAGIWSLMSGTVVVMAFEAVSHFMA